MEGTGDDVEDGILAAVTVFNDSMALTDADEEKEKKVGANIGGSVDQAIRQSPQYSKTNYK